MNDFDDLHIIKKYQVFSNGIDDIFNISYNNDDISRIKQYIFDLSSSVNNFLDDIDLYFNKKINNSPTVGEIYYKKSN